MLHILRIYIYTLCVYIYHSPHLKKKNNKKKKNIDNELLITIKLNNEECEINEINKMIILTNSGDKNK